EEIKLLGVDVGARDVEADIADHDDAALAAAGLKRLRQNLAAGRRRGDDHRVGAEPVGQLDDGLDNIVVGRIEADIEAVLPGDGDAARVYVGADHPAAVGGQQLRGDLAENAEPDHHHAFAERRLGAAHPLQGDGAEGDGR